MLIDQWLAEQRDHVFQYLEEQGLPANRSGASAAWQVAPYVSLWRIGVSTGSSNPEIWVISGDLPCDYIPTDHAPTPRQAIGTIARKWLELAASMTHGESHPDLVVGAPQDQHSLAPLLKSRAQLLLEWTEDDELWT
jgi:hypothetical protein